MTSDHSSSPKDRLARIIRSGLCTGCGLCEAVSEGCVEMGRTASGYERPRIRSVLEGRVMDRIEAICPGLRLTGPPDARISPQAALDDIWGYWRRIVLGWATDPDVRHRAATGGVLTALGQFLLASGRVETVLHARPGGRHPAFGAPQISTTAAEVMEGIGSRYGPTAPLTGLDALLDRGAPFAVIAKPCDLSAIANLARIDPRVDALIPYRLAMVCGGFSPLSATEAFARSKGIEPKDLTSVRYRGFGCPGDTVFETKDGQVTAATYTEFWGEDESTWSLPFRCKVCADGIAETADVAASDTWPGGGPDPATLDTYDPGTNAILIRTDRGMDLVEEAVAGGYLTLGEDRGPRYLDQVQPHQRAKKLAVAARWAGLRAEGALAPAEEGLRTEALSQMLGAQAADETEGTRRRVRAGETSEPDPVFLDDD